MDLELRRAVDDAELALASGDGAGALRAIDAVLAEPSIKDAPQVLRAAQQVRAGALQATGDVDSAIVLLEELTGTPTPDATWLKGLIALSRCYRESGDFPRAINVGEQSRTVIDELGISGLTEAIQLTVTTAGAYHDQGDAGQAMRTCMRALEAAEKYDSPVGKASAYWNAGIVEATHGSASVAIDLATKALALFELSDDNRNLLRLRATVARMHLLQDPPAPEAALELLSSVDRDMRASDASAWDISCLHLTRGKAYLLLGEHEAALDSATRIMETKPAGAPTLAAQSHVLKGQVAFAAGDRDRARSLFQAGVHALTAAGADREAAQLWFELADLLEEVGDHDGALAAFRSAGVSTGLRPPGAASAIRR